MELRSPRKLRFVWIYNHYVIITLNISKGYSLELKAKKESTTYIFSINKNQRTNGPLNAHLISGPNISTHKTWFKMAEQTMILNMITHKPSYNHLVEYINQIPGK